MDLVIDLFRIVLQTLPHYGSLFIQTKILEGPADGIGMFAREFLIGHGSSNHVVLVSLCRQKFSSPGPWKPAITGFSRSVEVASCTIRLRYHGIWLKSVRRHNIRIHGCYVQMVYKGALNSVRCILQAQQ